MDLGKWGSSYQKEANNTYFIYPSDEAEFEKLVFMDNTNKGLVIRIFANNGEFMYERIVDSKKGEWGNNTNPFTFVRGTSIKKWDIERLYDKYTQSTIKTDDTKIHQVFKNCSIYAVPKGYEDMLPPKVAKIEFDKDKFLNLIKAFMDKVDELRPTGSINGTGKDKWYVIEAMENLLQNIGYEPYFKFGGPGEQLLGGKWDNDAKVCSISFYRKDTIGFLNKKSIRKGVYIWLGYADKEQRDNIKLSISKGWEATECIAIDTIEKHRNNSDWDFIYNSNDFEAQKEQIANNFLYLVKEFDSIPLEYFKPKGDTMDNKIKTPTLNQILYGPPGTGKTYSTIDKALEILRHYDKTMEIPKSREAKRKIFDEYRANKQIEFVTFHQSFSYEEFVEGIKPNAENEKMTYEVKDGIFKDISEKALSNYQAYKDSLATLPQQQISTKELFQAFAQNLQEQLASAENGIDFNTPSLSTKMRISKIFYLKNEEAKSIFISTQNSESGQTLKRDIVLRDYEKFKSGQISSYKDIKPTYESLAQWHGNAIYYFALYEKLAEFEKTYKPQTQSIDKVALKPYILIIDEINRGNISKILGELITLIEPSKRIGASDEEKARGIGNESLEVTLPYSNETFGVPSNLYIIGTMNTADRSIALLDTALRRRFEFVEMMPDSSQLKPCGDIDLAQLLDKMNERIEFLLDREHTIGHSFFIGVDSLGKLREVFKLKIIPLLQEYFYDDYAKIQAVLNDNDMIKPKPKPEFLSKFSDEVNDEKVVYEIEKNWQKWELWQFVKIYNSKATKSQNQDSSESNEDE